MGWHLKRVLLGSSITTDGNSSLGCPMLDSRPAASCELISAGICIPDTGLQQNKASYWCLLLFMLRWEICIGTLETNCSEIAAG